MSLSLDSRLRGNDIVVSKSKTFFAFCSSFLAGVAVASLWPVDIFPIYVAIVICIVLLIFFWKNKSARLVVGCVLCLTLGIERFLIAFPTAANHVSTLAGQTVHLIGYVATEPDVRTDGVRYIVRVQNTNSGNIYVQSGLYPRYAYGDVLSLTCTIRKPGIIESAGEKPFRYDMYLARYHVFAICQKPFIEKIGTGEGSAARARLLQFKNIIATQISHLWHEPYASFMAGLLYGYRGGLGSLQEDFARTGVSHIVAVSGYNISIVGIALMYIFVQGLWINRKKAFWLVVFCILLFVIFTGMSASVVRAGIMGILTLTATQIGRQSRPGNILMLAATLMVLQNPFILLWDAGFQLSFAATVGIIYVAPLFPSPRKFDFPKAWELFTQTLSAIIMTLPLILFEFGRLSFVAPVVNMLVVWLVPILMVSGAATIAVSFFLPIVGQYMSYIVWAGLEYIVQVVRWFSVLPFATVGVTFPWWGMMLSYGIIFIILLHVSKQKSELVPKISDRR